MPVLRVYSAGSNAKGQLGTGSEDDSWVFAPVAGLGQVREGSGVNSTAKIANGSNHSIILYDGQLLSAGDNSRGQLFNLSTTFEPFRLRSDMEVVHVAAGWENSYLVLRQKETGSLQVISDLLLSIGSTDFGALGVDLSAAPSSSAKRDGIGEERTISFAHLIPQNSTYLIQNISSGLNHVIVILSIFSQSHNHQSQLVIGWGSCRHGQLGPISTPSNQSNLKSKRSPKTIPKPPSFIPTPIVLQVNDKSPITKVAAGSQHTILLHEDGTLTTWGSNRKNQLPAPPLPRVQDVQCTWNGTYLIADPPPDHDPSCDWSLLATGSGAKGQLGRAVPSSSSSTSAPAISSDLGPVELPSLPNHSIRKLACGSEHVLLLVENTTDRSTDLYVWGWNEHGNLGLGHNQDVFTPTRLPWTAKGRIVDVWAGCGTSWLLVEEED